MTSTSQRRPSYHNVQVFQDLARRRSISLPPVPVVPLPPSESTLRPSSTSSPLKRPRTVIHAQREPLESEETPTATTITTPSPPPPTPLFGFPTPPSSSTLSSPTTSSSRLFPSKQSLPPPSSSIIPLEPRDPRTMLPSSSKTTTSGFLFDLPSSHAPPSVLGTVYFGPSSERSTANEDKKAMMAEWKRLAATSQPQQRRPSVPSFSQEDKSTLPPPVTSRYSSSLSSLSASLPYFRERIIPVERRRDEPPKRMATFDQLKDALHHFQDFGIVRPLEFVRGFRVYDPTQQMGNALYSTYIPRPGETASTLHQTVDLDDSKGLVIVLGDVRDKKRESLIPYPKGVLNWLKNTLFPTDEATSSSSSSSSSSSRRG